MNSISNATIQGQALKKCARGVKSLKYKDLFVQLFDSGDFRSFYLERNLFKKYKKSSQL